ncbi:MAG: histidinol-phosphate transaminase [Desulfarculaceae bacterium]|nr:histidinol-phosphate transaminase [Desulfarculaceae bacterium]
MNRRKLPPVAPEIEALVPYKPGKPIEELERELGISGAIKLASNENPLGPSPKAVQAMADALGGLHRYPDGAGFELRSALAARYGLAQEQIVLGNGSNEIIEFLSRAFLRPGDLALAAAPSFLMYSKLVQVAGGKLKEVPLKDFRLDLTALAAAIEPRTRIVFVNNPDNPAGTAFSKAEFSAFLDRVPEGVLVVLDEAYIDFASDPEVAQGTDFLNHRVPVVVMRTFSKAYGLAGLRVGFGLGPVEVMQILHRVRQPFNSSILAQVAGTAALADEEFLQRTLEITWQGLKDFYACFEALGLEYVPSQANFVLVKIGANAPAVADELLKRGVIVRKMVSYGLPEHLRISVGLPEENQRFTKELDAILGGN